MQTSDSLFNITSGTLLTTVQLILVVSCSHMIRHLISPAAIVLLLTTVQLIMTVSYIHLIRHYLISPAVLLLTTVQIVVVSWKHLIHH